MSAGNENEEIETAIVDHACAIFHSMRDADTYQAKKHFEKHLRPKIRVALLYVQLLEASKTRNPMRVAEINGSLKAAKIEIEKLKADEGLGA